MNKSLNSESIFYNMGADEEINLRDVAKRHEAEKDYLSALNDYKKLIELNPIHYFYPFKAGYLLAKLKKFDEASEMYDLSVNILQKSVPPNNYQIARIHLLKGDCLREMGDYKGATDEYKVALDLDPTSELKRSFEKRMEIIKKGAKKRHHSKRMSKPTEILIAVLVELIAFVLIIVGSYLPIVAFNLNVGGINSSVSASIFSATITNSSGSSHGGYFGPNALWPNYGVLGSQIIIFFILLSIVIFAILDLLVFISLKKNNMPAVIKHYKGEGPKLSALIGGSFVALLLAYGGILVQSPLSRFILSNTEHIGIGLILIIAGVVVYFFRIGFKTNPNYVPYNPKKKGTDVSKKS
ncbi:MAG: tetratricopeptide repeat protein [Thermoplasmatales archaeon]